MVKITPDTQMRKIPPEMAQRIAMFLRRGAQSGEQGNECLELQARVRSV
jgi:hypothetical protein